MRHIYIAWLVAFAAPISPQAQVQTPPPPPQTARQALIEMFQGKSADAFEKHLPEVARSALIRKGETSETSLVQTFSMMGHQLIAGGRRVETFDVGPNLLISEQEDGKQKVEVTVEHDSLMGEQDEIEVSIHAYSNGEPQFLPVIPRFIFSMTEEKDIWRLSEVTVATHIPLTDPDYLKGVRKKADEADENMASSRVTMIVAAEMSYASTHPERGYTCHLADLFDKADTTGTPPQVPGGRRPELSGDESNGYHFSVSGCDGSPAPKFQITAVPTESDSGMKAFCSDESGRVRFDANGSGTACLSGGKFLNQATPVLPGPTD
ncbi:MAG TPA: hypothetical protein VFF64_12095 [Candidatus Eremiobacteraceae bacterium]|nr:hypothetical protein [Candidatus Eremiobacteraceae bacterium]